MKGNTAKITAIVILLILIVLCAFGFDRLSEEADNSEKSKKEKKINIEYGDSYTFSENVVKPNDYSDTILEFDEENPKVIKAVECGECDVKLENGKTVKIFVEPARITLVLFAGQSNCEGRLASDETVEAVEEQVVLNGVIY